MKTGIPELVEPAILVLGAISDPDGAYKAIAVHLSNLIPYLMEALNSSNEIMRSTTLWTVSKYSEKIAENEKDLGDYVTIICHKMIDHD